MRVKIANQEIRKYLNIETPDFPKYVSQILNLANQNAGGTRPGIVGKMSELIQQFSGKTLSDWEKWYQKTHPQAIKQATQKILAMVKNLREAMNEIDERMVEKWVKDLVILKTFLGLRFQKAILKKVAEVKKSPYREANFQEEGRGIDGYIGDIPVSIKPETYKTKSFLPEKLGAKIIYYKKVKDGIEIDYSELLKCQKSI